MPRIYRRHVAHFVLSTCLIACGENLSGEGSSQNSGGQAGSSSNPTSGGNSAGDNSVAGGSVGGNSVGGGAATSNAGGTTSGGGSVISQGTVGVFVVQGHLGYTTISCDEGRTWIEQQSALPLYRGNLPQDLRCFEDYQYEEDEQSHTESLDCDHKAFPGRGLVFGNEQIFATFGWGEPRAIRSSTDGAVWNTVLDGTTFGALAYVQETLIAGARMSRRSTDGGLNWSEAQDSGLMGWNVRRVGQSSDHGGRIILVGEAGDATISSDGGKSWFQPASFPTDCGSGIQNDGGIESGNGVWLVLGGNGIGCRSTDGGQTWTTSGSVGESISSHLVFDGSHFVVWSGDKAFKSTDGISWESESLQPQGLNLGVIAASPSGKFIGVTGGWKTWYEKQHFYFSDDGVNWTESENYVGSHPARDAAYGVLKRSEVCP